MRDEYDDSIAGKKLAPESLAMSYGYRPEWSEGAIKSPIFQTSTFVFESAAEGKRFFELAEGSADAEPGEKLGLIYSRLNNPDLEILENRLTSVGRSRARPRLRVWDGRHHDDDPCIRSTRETCCSTPLPSTAGPTISCTTSCPSSACDRSSGNPR